jgi:hypothetical protein
MMTDGDLSRFKRCLAAYGTRLDLWPDAARADAEGLRGRSAEAGELWRQAAALDGRLDADRPLQPSPELMAAVLASSPASASGVQRPWALTLWPFGPSWQPATGMAVAAVFGIFVGLSTPADDIFMASSFPSANDLIWEADEWETF